MSTSETSGQNKTKADHSNGMNGAVATNIEQGCAFFKDAVSIQEEMLRFCCDRMGAGIEIFEQMRRCTNMMEVVEVQQKWLKSAGSTYADESRRLGNLALKLAVWRGTQLPPHA